MKINQIQTSKKLSPLSKNFQTICLNIFLCILFRRTLVKELALVKVNSCLLKIVSWVKTLRKIKINTYSVKSNINLQYLEVAKRRYWISNIPFHDLKANKIIITFVIIVNHAAAAIILFTTCPQLSVVLASAEIKVFKITFTFRMRKPENQILV